MRDANFGSPPDIAEEYLHCPYERSGQHAKVKATLCKAELAVVAPLPQSLGAVLPIAGKRPPRLTEIVTSRWQEAPYSAGPTRWLILETA